MIRRGPIFRTVSAVLLVTTMGCVSWRPLGRAPHETISSEVPERVRVSLWNGTVVELHHPSATQDSIAGELRGVDGPRRLAIAWEAVELVEVGAGDQTAGIVTVLLIGGVVFFAYWARGAIELG